MHLKDRHPTRHQYPQPGFAARWIGAIAVALRPAGLSGMRHGLGLRARGGRPDRLGHGIGDLLAPCVERPQRDVDLLEVCQRLLRLPLTLAVGAAEQADRRHQARAVPACGHLRRQWGACHVTTLRAPQVTQPVFIHQRFDLW